MNQLAQLVQKTIDEDLAPSLEKLPEAEADAMIGEFVQSILTAVEESTRKSIADQSSAHLAFAKERDDDFAQIVVKKWGNAFDQMEVLWGLCEELARTLRKGPRDRAAADQDYRFDALSHIQARALLVTREILCLLKGGYPDGALARWRSLHEHSVHAVFIASQDQPTAMRFLAHAVFIARDNAIEYNGYANRTNMTPFSDAKLAVLKQRCEGLVSYTGELGVKNGQYVWAAETLKNRRPNLRDLEKATGLDHWRIRYRWASLHTHACHRPPNALLGAAALKRVSFLVGPSDHGYSDPIQMAAISLQNCTTALLGQAEPLDAIIWTRVVDHLVNQVIETAVSIEPDVPDTTVLEDP